ncbi:hypothetical protein [Micromonospora parva]|uniref:Uncharacterized protein n=1 Tax=Micromonospora parva TaxID=1464048 RepID=A0ABW6VMY8_9ACTN
MARIDFAHGRITTTAVPALRSGGPVSFLVGPDRVVIRPLEAVPGYVVPDGKPANRDDREFATGEWRCPARTRRRCG